jgi:hypothetical protein
MQKKDRGPTQYRYYLKTLVSDKKKYLYIFMYSIIDCSGIYTNRKNISCINHKPCYMFQILCI